MTQVTDSRYAVMHSSTHRRLAEPSMELSMKLNVGGLDRTLRVVAGLVLIALAATGTVGVWGYAGLILVATGAIGFCPAYPLLSVNTCATKKT